MGSCFKDKSIQPTDEMLAEVLCGAKEYWDALKAHVFLTYPNPKGEWKFYGTKSGWHLALFSGKRRLVNVSPNTAFFTIGFTFSEKAVEVILDSDLPFDIKKLIPPKTDCVCGRGVVLFITKNYGIGYAKRLIEIKDKN